MHPKYLLALAPFALPAVSLAQALYVGVLDETNYWSDNATGSPTSVTKTVTVNQPGDVTGTFDVIFTGQSSSGTAVLSNFTSRLVVDTVETASNGDDRNINADESITFQIANVNLTSFTGNAPRLTFESFRFYTSDNSSTLVDDAIFTATKNGSSSFTFNAIEDDSNVDSYLVDTPYQSISEDDAFTFQLTTPGAAATTFRFDSLGFSATAIPEPSSAGLLMGLAGMALVGAVRPHRKASGALR